MTAISSHIPLKISGASVWPGAPVIATASEQPAPPAQQTGSGSPSGSPAPSDPPPTSSSAVTPTPSVPELTVGTRVWKSEDGTTEKARANLKFRYQLENDGPLIKLNSQVKAEFETDETGDPSVSIRSGVSLKTDHARKQVEDGVAPLLSDTRLTDEQRETLETAIANFNRGVTDATSRFESDESPDVDAYIGDIITVFNDLADRLHAGFSALGDGQTAVAHSADVGSNLDSVRDGFRDSVSGLIDDLESDDAEQRVGYGIGLTKAELKLLERVLAGYGVDSSSSESQFDATA